MKEVLHLSLKEAKDRITCGEISPMTLCLETIGRIKNSQLNSFITVTDEHAMAKANHSTRKVVDKSCGKLEGIPISIKDIFCTKGIKTTAGSKMLDNFVPVYESTVTRRLIENGCIVVGKNNMDEFAMGSSNQTSYFGPVKNPWNHDYVPGGSSGGSAAAVADYLCYASIGSDTGGSVRQPASFCGIVGLKPSYGRCSRFGIVAYSSSLDQAGVFARSVEDACIVLDEMMGSCERDSTTTALEPPNLSNILPNIAGKRIGYVPAHMEIVDAAVRDIWQKTIDVLKTNGATLVELSLNDLDPTIHGDVSPVHRWIATYYSLTPVEAFSNLSRYDGIRYGSHLDADNLQDYYRKTRSQFGDEVKKRIMLGSYILLTEGTNQFYSKAVEYRSVMQKHFRGLFSTKLDAILSPTSPHEAFKLGASKTSVDMYSEDMFTILANLLGAPAISIPAGLGHNGLPIGMQIITGPFQEVKLIEIARFLELQFKFKKLHEVMM